LSAVKGARTTDGLRHLEDRNPMNAARVLMRSAAESAYMAFCHMRIYRPLGDTNVVRVDDLHGHWLAAPTARAENF